MTDRLAFFLKLVHSRASKSRGARSMRPCRPDWGRNDFAHQRHDQGGDNEAGRNHEKGVGIRLGLRLSPLIGPKRFSFVRIENWSCATRSAPGIGRRIG
jgi:hypothetical protein